MKKETKFLVSIIIFIITISLICSSKNEFSILFAPMLTIAVTFFGWYLKQICDLKEKRKSLLLMLLSELQALYDMGCMREQDISLQKNDSNGEIHLIPYLPINSNYFLVYESNIANIGIINNADLVSEIIQIYAELKGLVDSLLEHRFTYEKSLSEINEIKSNLNLTNEAKLSRILCATNYSNGYIDNIAQKYWPNVKNRIENILPQINEMYEKDNNNLY